MKEDRDVTWSSIELTPTTDKFVILSGYIRVHVGDVVSLGDTKITVTDEFVKTNPVNLVRVILPISIVEKNDAELMHEHINYYNQLKQVMPIEELLSLVNKLKVETFADILASDAALDVVTRPKEFDGFNLENLSDLHQLQVRYFTESGSKTKN